MQIPRFSGNIIWFVVISIYLVGLAGFMVPGLHGLFVWLIPFNLLFAFVVLALGEERIDRRLLLYFSVCYVFGYFIELAGTKTGLIFGEYAYGKGLGVTLAGVPLMIGVNWFFMAYTSVALASVWTKSKWLKTILAPLMMVLYDYFLEPFAIRNHMWSWQSDIVPLQNYIAWFLGGLFLCSIAIWGKFNFRNRFAAGLFVVQCLFFIILFLWHGWQS